MAIEVSNAGGMKTAELTTDAGVADIAMLKDIEALQIAPQRKLLNFSQPCSFPTLRVLHVKNCLQRLVDMVDTRTLQNLKWLVVSDSEGSLVGMASLGAFDNLERLKIRMQTLLNEELEWLFQVKHLQSLAITDSTITDESLLRLTCRESLRRLDVFRTKIALVPIGFSECVFSSVRSLDISETEVDSNSIEVIQRMFPNLERLIAQRTRLAKDDIRKISGWPALKVLNTDNPGLDFDHHGDEFWDL
jgi:hypothetical protein